MAHKYEIEIKSLLGSKQKADDLKGKLFKKFPDIKLAYKGKQLNHYFNAPSDLSVLKNVLEDKITEDKKDDFQKIISEAKKISVRTRETDGKVIFIMKASVNDHTSANGTSRIEFECEIPNTTLDELDNMLIKAGLSYEAKWSREREEYKSQGVSVCIDKNAGYGYLAEFEKVTEIENKIEEIKNELMSIMEDLDVHELPQDRLERMFAHYNKNWRDYYGTEKTFIIE